MKIIYKIIFILTVILTIASCAEEQTIKPDPSFVLSYQRRGDTVALAGTPFYVIPTGAGEFLTLYDGSLGHVWGTDGATGTDFNKADSMSVNYNVAGTYMLTVVTSSTDEYGKKIIRSTKTVPVKAVDRRNSFISFNINGVDGNFTPNDSILFSVPDNVTNFNFVAYFGLDSNDSKAYVNGVEQISGVTSNDFSQPVVYTVKSSMGDVHTYIVKFSTFPSSGEKALTQFALGYGGNGEVGIIDEANKLVNLTVNYGSNPTSVKLVLASSPYSSIYLNNLLYNVNRKYNLVSTTYTIKVVAQNTTSALYTLNVTFSKPVVTFTFAGLVPAPQGVIDDVNKTITVNVLKGTDITKLVAVWTGSIGMVNVGGVAQVNGVTANDFTSPVNYTFYKGTSPGDTYKVIVNVLN